MEHLQKVIEYELPPINHSSTPKLPSNEVKMLLVTASRLYAAGLQLLLNHKSSRVDYLLQVTQTLSPDQFLELVKQRKLENYLEAGNFQMILLTTLPDFDLTVQLGQFLQEVGAGRPVLWLEMPEEKTKILKCVETGARGFILEQEEPEYLNASIIRAAMGEAICSPKTVRHLFESLAVRQFEPQKGLPGTPGNPPPPELTNREVEVLNAIAYNMSNREIADQLKIELRTVKNHVHNILEKLQVSSRQEAALLALQHIKGYGKGRFSYGNSGYGKLLGTRT